MSISDLRILYHLPDSPRRHGGTGDDRVSGSRNCTPRPGWPADPWHRGAGEPPGARTSAVEPKIPPDGQRYQWRRPGPRLWDAFGLRAGLSHVKGMAHATYSQDGRGGRRYRLAATLSPGTDGLRTNVEFHLRGRFAPPTSCTMAAASARCVGRLAV